MAGDFDPVKMQKLISSVIESGHGSTIEHVVFTFAITGVSRTLSRTSSSAIGRAWPSISRASAT